MTQVHTRESEFLSSTGALGRLEFWSNPIYSWLKMSVLPLKTTLHLLHHTISRTVALAQNKTMVFPSRGIVVYLTVSTKLF